MMREYPTFERIKIKDRHNKNEQQQQQKTVVYWMNMCN